MSDDQIPSMIEFSTDIGKAEAPDPLPAGSYVGTIRAAEVKMSQRDTRYAAVTFHISPDQYPADYKDGNPDGTILVYRRVGLEDNPQAKYGLRRFLESIGAPTGKKIDVNDWVGNEATIEISHEMYEGINRANISKVSEA